jgi:hypothetical protein
MPAGALAGEIAFVRSFVRIHVEIRLLPQLAGRVVFIPAAARASAPRSSSTSPRKAPKVGFVDIDGRRRGPREAGSARLSAAAGARIFDYDCGLQSAIGAVAAKFGPITV